MRKLEDMKILELKVHLQTILSQFKEITLEQRYAVKSALEAFDLISVLGPGLSEAANQIKAGK